MNFYGHAAVALWRSADPGFVLGAMLPDFATMIRARPPGSDHAMIRDGIAFHHRTDEVFHACEGFRTLSSAALVELGRRGIPRGSARAVAHIGVEILLDGAIARLEPASRTSYLEALEQSREEALGGCVEWRGDAERERFGELRAVLARRGVAADDVAPELVAFRLARALSGRPRLSLDEQSEREVCGWVVAASASVALRAPDILDALRRALVRR